MKKLLVLILLASMLLSAAACTGDPQVTERESVTLDVATENESESESETETESETEPTETEAPVPAHTEVECRAIGEWQDVGLTFEGSEHVVVFSLPADWVVEPYEAHTYLLRRDGIEIGTISTNVPATALKKVATDYFENGVFQLDYEIRLVRQGNERVYRHVFACFIFTETEDRRVFLEIDLPELDADAARHVAESMAPGSHDTMPLRLHLSDKGSRRILVIGNSFISTSKIGSFLTEWLSLEGTYTVEAVSLGMASVEDYAGDEWLNKIKNHLYAAVFMCGFYNNNDVQRFPRVIAACHQSGTELIMFNAHNENVNRVPEARAYYSHVTVLDWQGKINALIESGVDYWDFCVDDSHKHSTPLAGYVGAAMIYRALFGEAPPDYSGNVIRMEDVKRLLPASFFETGMAPGERFYEVYTLCEETVTGEPANENIPDRDTLKRIAATEWREVGFHLKGSEKVAALTLPANWELREHAPHTYLIYCDGTEIGRVSSHSPSPVEREAQQSIASVGFTLDYEIQLAATRYAYEWRHVFILTSDEGKLYLEVGFAELDADGVKTLLTSFGKAALRDGNFKIPTSQSNGSDKIFIIGNSFVRTSAVGDFLTNFMKNGNKDVQVVWESVSGAVARGYDAKKYLDPIKNGEYSVVFLCGLYYDEDLYVIGKYLDACRQSDTLLVVYPAHNERQPQINMAKEAYPTVLFMDWKEEINEIIDTGVSFWEFCVDDDWHHSKPPAGYIGAHMIYTALFDEIPPEYTGTQVTMKKLRTLIPASYFESGFTPAERQITIYQLCG